MAPPPRTAVPALAASTDAALPSEDASRHQPNGIKQETSNPGVEDATGADNRAELSDEERFANECKKLQDELEQILKTRRIIDTKYKPCNIGEK
ncbi:hypothetical protein VTN49DRAFT_4096 [Thermomyces lanuginosus]|uniref:uncharacterized protein n=1 Tax=Thermomyces lanuginosus TaxID=5541 RepID=UPI003741F7A6